MSEHGSRFQRSRNGCLTCRRKRKKCDEKRPVCSRCNRTDSDCTWPPLAEQASGPYMDFPWERQNDVDNILLAPPYLYSPDTTNTRASGSTFEPVSIHSAPFLHESLTPGDIDSEVWKHTVPSDLGHSGGFGLFSLEPLTLRPSLSPQFASTSPSDDDSSVDVTQNKLSNVKTLATTRWDHAHDYGPVVVWPPVDTESDDDFDPEGVIPFVRRSITSLRIPNEPVFQELLNFFSVFLTRYLYDYATIHESLMIRIRRRFEASDSIKHGMLSTAFLFRANYERSVRTASLRNHAKELHLLATNTLQLELENARMSPWAKLASLMELTNHEYWSGNLATYYHHLNQAASVVRTALGSKGIDLLNLSGEQTFDVRFFAWCDILSSMALSRPTLLHYESDLQSSSQLDALGQDFVDPDRGVEWIFGCPDALAVFLARTTALRHAHVSAEEKAARGHEIEQLVRHWQFRPVRAKQSMLRVARLGAQEIWRHTAILYVHQAVFKSECSCPAVTDSVKHIIRIASTLKPGVNPDCFLPVPYFIAGFFATNQKDRYTLRSRILSCGNERFLRHLVGTLDDLWKETDATGCLTSWSRKQPPTFMF